MLALAKPIHIQKTPIKLQTKKKQLRRPVRNVKVRSVLPDQDFINYSLFQLTSWVMPMTIAGRFMKMEFKDIGVGLVALGVTKTLLEAGGIIHY
jgi:hypothetical protein